MTVDNAFFPVQQNYSLGKNHRNAIGSNHTIVSNHVLSNMITSRIKADRRGYFRCFLLRVHKQTRHCHTVAAALSSKIGFRRFP